MARLDIDAELAALETMSLEQLRIRWSKLTGTPIPKVSAALLRLALAWELQSSIDGGVSRGTFQKLEQIASQKTSTQDLQPGMRLTREWNGRLHVVTIDDAGTICWNDRDWPSLSAVARTITGTRWSGPAFFGLKQKAKAA